VKIVRREKLVSCGAFEASGQWQQAAADIDQAIADVVWPPGTRSGLFKIFPESGKRRGKGNGVKPIRKSFAQLINQVTGWTTEAPCKLPVVYQPGDIDAFFNTPHGPITVEWETGNISSAHRSLNKLALMLHLNSIAAGVLIVPSKALATYLTDRIANYEELRAYFALWKAVRIRTGLLQIIVVEHDATSNRVCRIPKGRDGRAQA